MFHTMSRDLSCRPHELLKLRIKDVIFKIAGNYQVISNLLNNTTKFPKEGTILVTADKKGSEVIVSVKDTGQGIDPEMLPKLYTKFATKSSSGRTGLGLFISKSIIEAHGGKIWAENNPDGRGVIFSFSLPIGK